jgi:hypothetical protein
MASAFRTHADYLGFCSLIKSSHLQSSAVEVEWSDRASDSESEFLGQFSTSCFAVGGDPGFSFVELGEVGQAIDVMSGGGDGYSSSYSTSNAQSVRLAVRGI